MAQSKSVSRFGVEDSELNRKQCMCWTCKSYPHDSRGEVLYCGLGASRCDIRARECVCSDCPIYFENKLDSVYYCNKAIAGEQSIEMRKRLSYEDPAFYQRIVDIKDISASGESLVKSMGSLQRYPYTFELLHFVPAQAARIPLNADARVTTSVTIGPGAKRPFKVSSPIMITGMSLGATSMNVKLMIARAAKKLKIAFKQERAECSAKRSVPRPT